MLFRSVYPYSMKSATVVNAFKDRLHSLDIGVAFNTKVCNVKRDDGGFSITCVSDTNEKIQVGARVVCLALGGKAAPKFGTVGEGFVIAKELGLEVSPVFPILTKINLEGMGDDMAGVRHDANDPNYGKFIVEPLTTQIGRASCRERV